MLVFNSEGPLHLSLHMCDSSRRKRSFRLRTSTVNHSYYNYKYFFSSKTHAHDPLWLTQDQSRLHIYRYKPSICSGTLHNFYIADHDALDTR